MRNRLIGGGIVTAVVAALGLVVWMVAPPATAAPVLSSARGWCVKAATGEVRSLRLTTSGKCQNGYWGPVALGSGAKGPQGPVGPQGPKGEPGKDANACPDGHSLKDVVVANAAKTAADAKALTAAQEALKDAKAALVAKEKAVEDADAAIVKAQAAVDAATSVAEKEAAAKVLADAVVAKAAAVNAVGVAQKAVAAAQAAVDKIVAEIAAPATYTLRTCVKG